MTALRSILVPIDGSDNSLRALAYVVKRERLAKRPFRVVLLNVQPQLPSSSFVSRTMIKEHLATQSDEALAPARRWLARRELAADVCVRVGEPAQTIVDVARQIRCGEIAMGTRGVGGLKGLLLGSVTTKVIQLARRPVTVIP
jgi:nucleotide-binding universal stress UspA family protein